eukprot:CAMPEP_0116857556 /NCGR_PEP_ID=MMETSP0418-20121206/20617_1 /TAXON_ID=1158023 /ORGANISM="Astrosyne radiata, Strain 13vi08-1A" /LENGTH=62 /DNA_ID=CAMNT_0004491249 /DNA_START=1 /DNA_END=186 /DNA_ORIENTATION=-
MLLCSNGFPYPDFVKFRDYYGFPDYADKWVLAALDGTATAFTNGNADFSMGTPNDLAFRAEA